MGEELRLEDTVDKRVRFLRTTNNKREPVILEVGTADTLDGADWDRTLRRDDQLVVDDILGHDIDMSTRLRAN